MYIRFDSKFEQKKRIFEIMDEIEAQFKEEEEKSLLVFVTGYPTSASINDITSIFSQCGEVEDVKMTISEAIIKYKYHNAVEEALKMLNQTSFIGHILNVTRTKQIKSPSYKSSPEKTDTSLLTSDEKRNSCIKKTNWEIINEIANNKRN